MNSEYHYLISYKFCEVACIERRSQGFGNRGGVFRSDLCEEGPGLLHARHSCGPTSGHRKAPQTRWQHLRENTFEKG